MAAADESSLPYVMCNDVQKSFKDDRDYRYVVLENGLQALLVADAEADKASAAMCVKVGHFSDPDNVPGLAHFCEHMLFLGTEKYPDENSYSAFLNKNGGWSNAYTASEDTNYFFEVQHAHLEEALDRFAQFFIGPLFTESCVSRELNAVNSENTKNLQNDMWRLYQLSKSTSKPDHAYHKFGTGNLETLKETPEAEGVNVRDELLKFHKTYYSANVMRLCVVGRNSLDDLEAWVKSKFVDIRNTNREPPKFPAEPIGPEQLGIKYVVVPVKDTRKVTIEWPMPPTQPHFRVKPSSYCSHLVGHEGPGSLLSLLKARNLATELMAGASESDSSFAIFGVTITLTPLGLEQVDEVVKMTMQYMQMIREAGPQKWVWDECQATAAMSFRYKSKENPGNYATSVARQMHQYPPELTLSGPSLYFDYDADVIVQFLKCLVASNMRLVVVSKDFEDQTDAEERWYKTKYKATPFTDAQKAAWGDLKSVSTEMHLPAPNDFIATDFSLRFDEDTTNAAVAPEPRMVLGLPVPETIEPTIVRDDALARLWHVPDTKFFQPKTVFTVRFRTPAASQSARDLVVSKLYIKMVKEALNEFAYSATIANLRYGVSSSKHGISLEVSGFSHKLPILLTKLAEKMVTVEFSEAEFERSRDLIEKNLKNFAMEQPYRHSIHALEQLTEVPSWPIEEQLEEVKTVTADELRGFIKRLLRRVKAEALVYGNATADDAGVLLDALLAPFTASGTKPLHPSQLDAARVVKLPTGLEFAYATGVPNAEETNSAIEVYFQVGPFEPRMQAALSVLGNIIREPAFDQLRTKEQLGYIVHSSTKSQFGVNGLRIIVQSHVLHPRDLDTRIEAFLANFRTKLTSLPVEEFEANRKAVAAQLLEPPKRMATVAQSLWYEINLGRYRFGRRAEQAAELEALTLERVIRFFDHYVARSGAGRRKLSAHAVCAAHAAAESGAEEAKTESVTLHGGVAGDSSVHGGVAQVVSSPAVPTLSLAEGLAVVSAQALDAEVNTAASEVLASAKSKLGLGAAINPVVVVSEAAEFRRSLPLFGSTERTPVSKL